MQIDHYTASTSYVGFQNGLSKAIGSIRKPIRKFSTGGQLVGGRCLYSNEVNNVKDLFLPCEASALLQQVVVVQGFTGVVSRARKLSTVLRAWHGFYFMHI